MVTRDNQCNQAMFSAFKNVIFNRFKRTSDKIKVIDYINKYRGRYSLNDSQNKEIENIINTLK